MIITRLIILITLLFTVQVNSTAQKSGDLTLIYSVKNIDGNSSGPVIKSNRKRIAPYLFKPAYLFYNKVIYKQMGLTCFYENPCIDFCGDLIEKFGLVKGYFLSFDRIVRCNRISPIETYPSGLTLEGKLIDEPSDYQN